MKSMRHFGVSCCLKKIGEGSVGNTKRAKLRQPAKFRGDRSNRCWHMVMFFPFFHDGGRPPSWICDAHVWTPRRAFGGLYYYAKVDWNQYGSFDNMQVIIFCDLGLKTPIHAPKLELLGDELVLTFGGCYLCASFGTHHTFSIAALACKI